MTENTKTKFAKPYPEFPLTPHPSGRWCKKVRGKIHYFGKIDEPDKALDKWMRDKDYLLAGRTAPLETGTVTVRGLINRFLTSKRRLLDNGEFSSRSFQGYYSTCERLNQYLGSIPIESLVPEDFEKLRSKLAVGRGPVSLSNEIRHVRIVVKYAYDAGLIDRPVRMGPGFRPPSRKVLRAERHSKPLRMFEADELQKILRSAKQPVRAMILLGINAALGQTDIAHLPIGALDLDQGWLVYPRIKTAVPRKVPLWPETIEALKETIEIRPDPRDQADQDLVFITRRGGRWVRSQQSQKRAKLQGDGTSPMLTNVDSVALEFGKILRSLDLKRAGLNFYGLRHTFETVAGESADQVAVNSIMGHVDDSMSAVYRERISDERLQNVTNRVREWLFPPKKSKRKSVRKSKR